MDRELQKVMIVVVGGRHMCRPLPLSLGVNRHNHSNTIAMFRQARSKAHLRFKVRSVDKTTRLTVCAPESVAGGRVTAICKHDLEGTRRLEGVVDGSRR